MELSMVMLNLSQRKKRINHLKVERSWVVESAVVEDRVPWVTSLEMVRLQNLPPRRWKLHRIRDLLQVIHRSLLQLHQLQMLISRFQLASRHAIPITISAQMDKTLGISSQIALLPKCMLPPVVDLPWVTCLAMARTSSYPKMNCVVMKKY